MEMVSCSPDDDDDVLMVAMDDDGFGALALDWWSP